jgi:hypothetical protein
MSDERKCFAGDLGTDQIGRVIEVTVEDGGKMSDELVAVRHTISVDKTSKRTYVHFKHIPDVATIFGKTGWLLEPESEVTVRA